MKVGMRVGGRFVIFVAVASIAASCVNTHKVRRPASPEAIAAINVAAGEHPPLAIDYKLGPQPVEPLPRQARSLQDADAKTITFIDAAGAPQPVESVLVKRVHVTNRAKGALQGFGIGALLGAVVGVVAAIAAEDVEVDVMWAKREEKQEALPLIASAVLGAVIGGVIGGAFGGAAGQQTEYVFDDRP